MDLIYLTLAVMCIAASVWFVKFCHELMEDKQ